MKICGFISVENEDKGRKSVECKYYWPGKGGVALVAVLFLLTSVFVLTPIFYDQVVRAGETAAAAELDHHIFEHGELEEFLDKLFTEKMAEFHVPGAVFSMVKDSEIFLKKGYGYADLENDIPVDPNYTLFRIGSVTKLVTATAVMQLYEQGLLDLEEDLNQKLSNFELEEKYSRPVTAAHLLTHTGGFDERLLGTSVRRKEDIVLLGQYLKHNMPPRVMPPGEVFSYSNHGMALAGFLVEEISGDSYYQYLESNIFRPLKMHHSTFPEGNGDLSGLARGYDYRRGRFEPAALDYILPSPAGAMVSTADDMARFMIAHLQQGYLDGRRILDDKTASEMHDTQFSHHPRLQGFTYGFYEMLQGGHRFIWHGGQHPGFVSVLLLLPEQNTGFFCAYNASDTRLMYALFSEFIEHFYPRDKPTGLEPVAANCLKRLTGNYRLTRYARTTPEKLLAMAMEIRVSAEGDTGLLTRPALSPGTEPTRWIQVEPFVFQFEGGEDRLTFRKYESGQISYMFTDIDSWERLTWYESAIFHLVLALFCIIVFLSALISWTAAYLYRRLFRAPAAVNNPFPWARPAAGILAMLNIIFVAGIVHLISTSPYELLYGLPGSFRVLLALPLITAVLSIILVFFTVNLWRSHSRTLAGRIYYTLVTLSALAFISLKIYWNLLGFY